MLGFGDYLLVSVILFFVGAIGVIFRRNLIYILMSLEIMLNSINITLIGLARYSKDRNPQALILFILVVAAVEVAVGLGIAINLMRVKGTVDVDLFKSLKG